MSSSPDDRTQASSCDLTLIIPIVIFRSNEQDVYLEAMASLKLLEMGVISLKAIRALQLARFNCSQ